MSEELYIVVEYDNLSPLSVEAYSNEETALQHKALTPFWTLVAKVTPRTELPNYIKVLGK